MSMNSSLSEHTARLKKAADKWAAKQKPQWGDEKWQRDLDEFGGLGYDIVQDIEDDLERKYQQSEENKRTVFYESKILNKINESLSWVMDNKLSVGWIEASNEVWFALQLSPGFRMIDVNLGQYHGFSVYWTDKVGKENFVLHPGDDDLPGFTRQKN